MHNFVASGIGHLENVDSLSYADIPNVETLLIQYQTLRLSRSQLISSVKSLNSGKAVKLAGADTSFPKFQFLLEAFISTTGSKYCQLFSLK